MSLSLTFARRELRSGVAGFRIFLACLAWRGCWFWCLVSLAA